MTDTNFNKEEIDDLITYIELNDNPQLEVRDWVVITQALEYYRESFKDN